MIERQHQLLDLLEVNGSLTISELASKLYVSMSTVRRDVSELEALKLVARMPQGVILLNREQGGVSLSYSLQTDKQAKHIIAKAAASLVKDKSTIFLASASTTLFMIPLLARKQNLTIITDGLEHAIKAAEFGIDTICIGGSVNASGKTTNGLFSEEMISKLHANLAFYSMPHISLNGNVWHHSADKIKKVRLMMANSDQNVLLVNNRIIGNKTETYLLCCTNEFDRIISDKPLPAELPLKMMHETSSEEEAQ